MNSEGRVLAGLFAFFGLGLIIFALAVLFVQYQERKEEQEQDTKRQAEVYDRERFALFEEMRPQLLVIAIYPNPPTSDRQITSVRNAASVFVRQVDHLASLQPSPSQQSDHDEVLSLFLMCREIERYFTLWIVEYDSTMYQRGHKAILPCFDVVSGQQ